MTIEFKFEVDIWEHGEYIITINGSPVGYTLDKKDAVLIKDWLTCSLAELLRKIETTRRNQSDEFFDYIEKKAMRLNGN